MKEFIQFLRDLKETRFDVHCHNLKGEESKEIYEILKSLDFTFCYVFPEDILAFFTGKYSRARKAGRILEEHGFTWPEDVAILGLNEAEERELLRSERVERV